MNPISYAKYLDVRSTTGIAKQLKVSRQYLTRVEQGLYDKPSDKILKWASEIISKSRNEKITPSAVEQLYKEWQWQQRESVKLNLVLLPVAISDYDRVSQPSFRNDGIIYYHKIFKQWREDYWHSSHAFCVDMCLHPSPVVDYEEGETHTMPGTLKKVLTHMNLIGAGFKTSER